MKTALLIIDVQNIYTDPESEMFCEEAQETISNINKLIDEMKESEVIYIRHIHKKDGSDLGRMFDYYEEEPESFDFVEETPEVEYDGSLKQIPISKHIVKNRYSAFEGTDLDEYLKEKDVEKVVICGFMTNFCCESTAREAHDKDFFVDFIIDATGTPGTDNYDQKTIRDFVGELLDAGIARVMNTSDINN